MSDLTIRPTPDQHLERLSLQAEALRAELEAFARTQGAEAPQHLLTSLTQMSHLLRGIQSEVAKSEQQRGNLLALAEISRMVNSSLDLQTVLREVMDTIIRLTGADRGFLMLKDETGELQTRVARNWERASLKAQEIHVSRTVVDWVVAHATPILTTNALDDPRFSAQESIIAYSLRSILCVPLKAKDRLIGVLYADSRLQEGLFNEEDRTLLTLFAHQAAVAIENARLFNALAEAYDQTLDALVAALDTRDRETEGHSQRVVRIALLIAAEMAYPEDDLNNLQRGALLHDIGKIGIPDAILRKPGPLDDDEWEIMRKHPEFGRRMLAGIPFLKRPLDVIYAHQERYDGTGYPEGLAGEEIPIGARIFAVADTFDAITSDRPYRKGQPLETARQIIRDNSGTQFDPKVVQVFLSIPDEVLVAETQNSRQES
ncbi:MAG: HD domain-containing phosphohydrolase [Anaerolineales bacterium]|jgi:HD-GYP domain-containing protein (c-di-GMP phosphodiesterase class II)